MTMSDISSALDEKFNTTQTTISYIIAIITTCSILINMNLVIVILRHKILYNRMNLLTCYISCVDCLQGLLVTPVFWLNALEHGWSNNITRCNIQAFAATSCCYLSIASITWLSINRYNQICNNNKQWSRRMYICKGLFNILCAILYGCYPYITDNYNIVQSSGIVCYVDYTKRNNFIIMLPFIHLLAGIVFCSINIITSYVGIYKTMKNVSIECNKYFNHNSHNNQDNSITYKMILIVVMFFCLTVPYTSSSIIMFITGQQISVIYSYIVAISIHMYSLTTPLLFLITNKTVLYMLLQQYGIRLNNNNIDYKNIETSHNNHITSYKSTSFTRQQTIKYIKHRNALSYNIDNNICNIVNTSTETNSIATTAATIRTTTSPSIVRHTSHFDNITDELNNTISSNNYTENIDNTILLPNTTIHSSNNQTILSHTINNNISVDSQHQLQPQLHIQVDAIQHINNQTTQHNNNNTYNGHIVITCH